MKIITDEILHLFVKNASLLSKKEIEEVETQLLSNNILKERIREIKLFYSFLENEEIQNLKISKYKLYNNIVPLYPFNKNSEDSKGSKLAAMNSVSKTDEFRHLTTFISSENIIMIRVQFNEVRNQYRIFLIAEDTDVLKNAVLMIEGSDKEYIPDNDGVILLTNIYINEHTNFSIKLKE
jgi:hypothetical protein